MVASPKTSGTDSSAPSGELSASPKVIPVSSTVLRQYREDLDWIRNGGEAMFSPVPAPALSTEEFVKRVNQSSSVRGRTENAIPVARRVATDHKSQRTNRRCDDARAFTLRR